VAGGAFAADIPPRPAPVPYAAVPPPVWTWTGCYLGGNIGGAFSQNAVSDPATGVAIVTVNGSGIVGGGQVGCDFQFAGGWVIGAAGNFQATSINTTTTVPGNAVLGIAANSTAATTHIPWIATATARLGYAFSPSTLFYVRGGGAWAQDQISITTLPSTPFATATDNRSGWTVGGGIEYRFAPYISGFVEYNYLDFGTRTVGGTLAAGGPTNVGNIRENIQEVLIGANFRFGVPR
jgi:outer membrane immunogenic protein